MCGYNFSENALVLFYQIINTTLPEKEEDMFLQAALEKLLLGRPQKPSQKTLQKTP